jgi:hypothetical protein
MSVRSIDGLMVEVSSYLNGNTCPGADAKGECSFIEHHEGKRWAAYVFLYDRGIREVTSTLLAQLFAACGCESIYIVHALHHEVNGYVEGFDSEMQAQPWVVEFDLDVPVTDQRPVSHCRGLQMIANGTPAMFHAGGKDRSCSLCAAHISLAREALGWEPIPSEGGRSNVDRSASAVLDVIAERERQRMVEGWTTRHDDEHGDGSLATVAACYALGQNQSFHDTIFNSEHRVPDHWPQSWDASWWKPKDRRRDLVRAAALLVAEIERLDRKAQPF